VVALRPLTRKLWLRLAAAFCATGAGMLVSAPSGVAAGDKHVAWPNAVAVVGFQDDASLRAALARFPARVVRRIPELRAAEVRPRGSLSRFASGVSALPGIAYVEPRRRREPAVEPALQPSPFSVGAYEWQFAATRSHAVPEWALRAAAGVTVAVVDTGADLSAPDLAAKAPLARDVRTGSADVVDHNGHGTFVASLAGGSVSNGEGIAGFGGDAKLLVLNAATPEGGISDVDAASAIVYAVEHGAKIVNLSFGGEAISEVERRAIDFAVGRGALLVAAAGNGYFDGSPVVFPAALLQPEGSSGRGGRGLVVAASTPSRARASFSSTGSYISVAAPGENVFAALSSQSEEGAYPRVPLPGSLSGLYGFGSGTSFASPQVAGAAALVWGVNPKLTAAEVAQVLKDTAQGAGAWNPELGYGVIDVAAAVARAARSAQKESSLALSASRTTGPAPLRVRLEATLGSSTADTSLAGRELVLESFRGRGWQRLAAARTAATGRVAWRFSLARGTYRLRARYVGAGDLAETASATITLRARPRSR
jgi:subtilisin family serine protease